ncbi:MAG: GNAT family N-acetyltransferase [Cyanobacteria bacterium P01_D01_bin.56]
MLIGPVLHRELECEAVLRSLPKWFGIEESLQTYARDSGKLPTFAIEQETKIVGFISLREHFSECWEVHCIAVISSERNKGIGTRLLKHSEQWLYAQGIKFLQVKTVAATVEDEYYAQTREFYARRGYTPVEIFPTLWSPHSPALQLIKMLTAI